jgi:hypothetical protein
MMIRPASRRLDEPRVRVDGSSYRLFLVRCGIDTHRGGWRAARFGSKSWPVTVD